MGISVSVEDSGVSENCVDLKDYDKEEIDENSCEDEDIKKKHKKKPSVNISDEGSECDENESKHTKKPSVDDESSCEDKEEIDENSCDDMDIKKKPSVDDES